MSRALRAVAIVCACIACIADSCEGPFPPLAFTTITARLAPAERQDVRLDVVAHINDNVDDFVARGGRIDVTACMTVPADQVARLPAARLEIPVEDGVMAIELAFDGTEIAEVDGSPARRCHAFWMPTLEHCTNGDCADVLGLTFSRPATAAGATVTWDVRVRAAYRPPDDEEETGSLTLTTTGADAVCGGPGESACAE